MTNDQSTDRAPTSTRDDCERFVEEKYRSLYRWFLWLTNSPTDAEDLTQDTFVALWESRDRIREGVELKPWLYGIARNVWRKRCARRSEDLIGDEAFASIPDPHPNPEDEMLRNRSAQILEQQVARLPHDYREAIVLRLWEELEYREIAKALAITEELVRWRVHQARKMLRERLRKAEVREEEIIRSGGKLVWWMRIRDRSVPPTQLLDRCIATIPNNTDEKVVPVAAAMTSVRSNQSGVRVCTLEELKEKQHAVISLDRPIVVFYNDGDVSAVDNRCPHMGFPLHRGSVEGGILTCYWHHARFDLKSGCTFDLFADDVPGYPVEIRDGEVWVIPRPVTDDVARWKQKLKEGLQHNIGLVIAKSIVGLLHHGEDTRGIVRQAALFGTCYRDRWADGLTILGTMANVLSVECGSTSLTTGRVSGVEKGQGNSTTKPDQPTLQSADHRFLPLWHGVVRVARSVYGSSPRWDRQPLTTQSVSQPSLKHLMRHWTLNRHRDGAERCLLTSIENGASTADVAEMLFAAATDRIYADGGHVVDFINKAFEILDLIGWEHASEVLPTLVDQLVQSRGGEESSAWKHPINLVNMLERASGQLGSWFEEGRRKSWSDENVLAEQILSLEPHAIIESIADAIRNGALPRQLSKALCYAAALRIARFGTANEFADWITVIHTFTYCNAVHQLVRRMTSDAGLVSRNGSDDSGRDNQYDCVHGILHGAMGVYLDRFLNIPPTPIPEHLDDEPEGADELLSKFLDLLDRTSQVNRAGRVVARYLSLGHAVEALIQTLTYAVVREDAEFHTYQMLEAAVRQYEEWKGSKESHHILIAAARYIAAHAPTQRTMLQTANVALRLHRGEDLYEGGM